MKASKIAKFTVLAMATISWIGFIVHHLINQYSFFMTFPELLFTMLAHVVFGCIPMGLVLLVVFGRAKNE